MAVAHSPAAACGTLPGQHQQPPTEPNQKQLMSMQFRGTYSCMQKCVSPLPSQQGGDTLWWEKEGIQSPAKNLSRAENLVHVIQPLD